MKNILVIGGSRGIGLETVKTLLQKGYHVTLFSRGASKVNLMNPNLHLFDGNKELAIEYKFKVYKYYE